MTTGRWILATALLIGAVACQPAGPAAPAFTAEDEAAIEAMHETFVATLVAADWEGNAHYYTSDAVRMPPDAPMFQGLEAIKAWGEAFPPVTAFSLSAQKIEGHGNLAYARGTYKLEIAPPDAEPLTMVGKWQAVYERQDDGTWLCLSDIWNTDAPVPPLG